jgi:thiamine-monophosphate kinase
LTEDDLIARYFKPLAGPGALGLEDDAALLPASADGLVVTTDALVAGVHFFADDPPGAIAKKALRVNLSDLAAKGAEPLGFQLALALPRGWTPAWLEAFAAGLGEDSRAFACPLLGGDTVATPGPLTLSITALGRAPDGRFVPRTGARAGDSLYVTGAIGDAALGLVLRRDPALAARLTASSRDLLLNSYLMPLPRLALAPALRHHAHGAMDVSDGLAGDLSKFARASGVGACVDLSRVPLSQPARELIALDATLFEIALTGGDDYEILCAAAPDAEAFQQAAQAAEVVLTRIGVVTPAANGVIFRDSEKKEKKFNQLSFDHFR